MNIKKVVIPAAGLGTRFLPATKAQPKEMLPIVDKPTIQYIVEEAVKSGATSILIITGRGKRAIEDHFDASIELETALEKGGKDEELEVVRGITNLANIHYVRQKEPKGLGHAISCARDFVGNDPFGVILGDDIVVSETPALKQLAKVYEEMENSVVGVQSVNWDQVHKYGIVKPAGEVKDVFELMDMVEKPIKSEAPSNKAILGRYILTPGIFEALEKTAYGKGGEMQLTDAIKILMQKEKVYACAFEGKRYDVGDRMGFLQATVEFALKREDIGKEFRDYIRHL